MLISESTLSNLPLLGFNEGKNPRDINIPIKIYNLIGAGVWYIFERNPETNICFGVANIFEAELGYIDLNELFDIHNNLGISIVQDKNWSGSLYDVAKLEGLTFLLE